MIEPLDSALLARLQEVLDTRSATEAELRALADDADAWSRALYGQIEGSERRLRGLEADPTTPLSSLATELRRVERLRDELNRLQTLRGELAAQAQELRASWILRQASSLETS
jgi:chromosome segregation ATPase